MKITPEHIASKKVIGKLKGKDVTEVVTTGGLHMIVTQKSNKFETIAVGPHRAVARYIAEKQEPELIITELSKSDSLDPVTLLNVVPMWEEISAKVRK